jgi:hypothetical protein
MQNDDGGREVPATSIKAVSPERLSYCIFLM